MSRRLSTRGSRQLFGRKVIAQRVSVFHGTSVASLLHYLQNGFGAPSADGSVRLPLFVSPQYEFAFKYAKERGEFGAIAELVIPRQLLKQDQLHVPLGGGTGPAYILNVVVPPEHIVRVYDNEGKVLPISELAERASRYVSSASRITLPPPKEALEGLEQLLPARVPTPQERSTPEKVGQPFWRKAVPFLHQAVDVGDLDFIESVMAAIGQAPLRIRRIPAVRDVYELAERFLVLGRGPNGLSFPRSVMLAGRLERALGVLEKESDYKPFLQELSKMEKPETRDAISLTELADTRQLLLDLLKDPESLGVLYPKERDTIIHYVRRALRGVAQVFNLGLAEGRYKVGDVLTESESRGLRKEIHDLGDTILRINKGIRSSKDLDESLRRLNDLIAASREGVLAALQLQAKLDPMGHGYTSIRSTIQSQIGERERILPPKREPSSRMFKSLHEFGEDIQRALAEHSDAAEYSERRYRDVQRDKRLSEKEKEDLLVGLDTTPLSERLQPIVNRVEEFVRPYIESGNKLQVRKVYSFLRSLPQSARISRPVVVLVRQLYSVLEYLEKGEVAESREAQLSAGQVEDLRQYETVVRRLSQVGVGGDLYPYLEEDLQRVRRLTKDLKRRERNSVVFLSEMVNLLQQALSNIGLLPLGETSERVEAYHEVHSFLSSSRLDVNLALQKARRKLKIQAYVLLGGNRDRFKVGGF